jgi:glyoxylase-like metal-dependent hydrolase (beta-lactamase superfamily II)
MIVDFKEILGNIYRLDARLSGLELAFVVYLIKQSSSGVLIEPGPAAVIPDIEWMLKEIKIWELKYIIPTHIHVDHGGGVGRLAQIFPSAKIVVHRKAATHVIDPSRLIEGTKMLFGDEFEKCYGPILPVPEPNLMIVQDGDRLFLNNRELTIIYTPGHAVHHISIFDDKVKGVFCGEAFGIREDAKSPLLPSVAPPIFDTESYLSSIGRIMQRKPEFLFYSHGDVRDNPWTQVEEVSRNTKKLQKAVLDILKVENNLKKALILLEKYIQKHFGITVDKFYIKGFLIGFEAYFKRQGTL